MIRFLHAADLHLDTAFSYDAPQRRREHRAIPAEIVRLANAHGCDLLLLAGDLFDSADVFPETVEALQRALAQCRAQVFIAPGNHDCLYRGSPYLTARWPENVHIFRREAAESVSLPELGCRVWGAAFTDRSASGLLTGFRADGGETQIMVLHGDAMNAASPYNAVTKAEISASGLDYLALGHIHARSALAREGGTFYAWPGCPMGRGFDETGEKGVYLGTLERGACELEFLPLGGRRYETCEVRAGDDPRSAILAALPEDTARDIYRVTLTGEADPIDLPALQASLADRFYRLELTDATRPKAALWAGAGDDTLRGQFLARLKQKYDAADDDARQTIALAARLGVAAIEGRDEVIEP